MEYKVSKNFDMDISFEELINFNKTCKIDLKSNHHFESFNGILISRHKFIDMLYLYIECLKEIENELCNPNILPDEIKELNEAKEFILSKDNLGVIILNSLVHSSNCSHYALLKIVKEVFVKAPFNISLEESFNDILYGDRKGSI